MTASAPHIVLVQGNIVDQEVDAIVNAANSSLMGGGGVDGAIHDAGGPSIVEECEKLRSSFLYRDGLPAGEAVATTAGYLPATWVIHTVGPIYSGSHEDAETLASCHRESLRVADELGAETIAFPAISTGIFGYPAEEAAPVAIKTVLETPTKVDVVRFVLWSEQIFDVFQAALNEHAPGS